MSEAAATVDADGVIHVPAERVHAPAAQLPPLADKPLSDFERLMQREWSPRTLLVSDNMTRMRQLAEDMAGSKITVPKHLQGSVGDCMAVITQAMQWNFNHIAVAQKTHIVNGALGYESQLIIAALNASPLLATRINFAWEGDWRNVDGKADKSDDRAAIAFARLRGESEPRVLRVSMAQVGGVRNSPLWAADPRQQLAYLAGKKWGRLHAPDVILGVYSPDELEDGAVAGIGKLPPNATPTQIAAAAAPKAERTDKHAKLIAEFEKLAREHGFEAFKERWGSLDKADRVALGTTERDRIGEIGRQADAAMAAEGASQEPGQ